jgi:NAD(P)-dependent dehydrogenase (short-subunit alcohol dehydrogenase family)
MQGKVCLVTGANRGIGRATAEGLARLGATVIMVCRNRAAGEQARQEIIAATGNTEIELLVADLSVQAEVRALAREIHARHPQLHLLVSNAGVYHQQRVATVDGIEATFAVNHLAGFILIRALLDVMQAAAPARIVLVASAAHWRATDPEDWESAKGYRPLIAYSRSKLANVIFGYDLARRLEGTRITVNSCHPGLVNSQLLEAIYDRWWLRWLCPATKKLLAITAEEGAETVLYLATAPELDGVTGKYFRNMRAAASSRISHDTALGERLWGRSLRYVGDLPAVKRDTIAAN